MATRREEDEMLDELVHVSNKCSVCAKKSIITEADKYCVDCSNYYCSLCADIHTIVPHMEGHKLLDKTAFKSFRSDGTLPSLPTQRCSIHPSKVVDMFCQEHDEVACASCIALNHRSCNSILSVPENIGNLYERSEVIYTKQNITLAQKSWEDIKKSKEVNVKQLKSSLNTAIDFVKTLGQELKALLDKIEHDTIAEFQREFERIQAFIETEINETEQLKDELKNAGLLLKNAKENKAQEFICTKTSKKVLIISEQKMKHFQSQPEEKISFTADQIVKSFLQHINVFDKDKCKKPSDTVKKARLDVKPKSTVPNTTLQKTNLYNVIKRKNINVKLPNDKNNCHIYGFCITQDGYLLLADSNNKNLKRVDLSTETVTDYLSLVSVPNAVCLVSNTEAAVSLPFGTLQFVTLGDQMIASRTLSFKHYCWGLAYSNDKLFISDSGNSLYIHDINGQELRRITIDASGNDIFKDTRQIAVSADLDRVFVADLSKGLIILDIQGNYLSTLSESEIQASSCNGVCTDVSNVFVCGYSSDNVVQIGQDYNLIGEVEHVSKPLSLYYSSQTSILFVTKSVHSNDGGNTVLVLELA